MQEHNTQLQDYIYQQIQSGQSPDDIDGQLRSAGWGETDIRNAFQALQARVVPTAMASTQQPAHGQSEAAALPQANGLRRGRIRTGWQLFKQSLTVLRGNRYLLRYLLMTGAWVFGITAAFVAVYWIFDATLYQNDYSNNLKPFGYVLMFFDYLFIYFFINLYAAGLTANVLDIFKGKRKDYREYMHIAWGMAPAILVYSSIEAVVGMFLRYVVERIRFVGWLLAWIFGTLWSLGTLFVIPILVTSEKPNGVTSIKESIRFFKQTWGQSITAKVSVNAPLFFLNLTLVAGLFLGIFGAVQVGTPVLIFAVIIAYFILAVALAVVGSFANSLVNIALFYYAAYHKVPPAFSADLLNQVFIKRQKRGLFKRAPQPEPSV